MPTLDILKRRINNAEDLQSVVSTMKTLAAVNIRQYEHAAESLEAYNEAIELGLQIVLRNLPIEQAAPRQVTKETRAALILGSDQGMCGRFNDDIVGFAVKEMTERSSPLEEWKIISVGERAAVRLADAGAVPPQNFKVLGAVANIAPLVQDVLLTFESWRNRGQLDELVIVFNQHVSGATYHPTVVDLLPLDRNWFEKRRGRAWPTNMLPMFTLDWRTLLANLVREYLYVGIYRAISQSLASENASRLSSMQAAEKNIDERLAEITNHYHRERQNAITEEIHDIVSGFIALTD